MDQDASIFVYRHVILDCMLQISFSGKRFGDAGLRDLAVTGGVIVEGSIDSVLGGRQYNRGVRLMKVAYEVLSRLLYTSFCSWLEDSHPEMMGLQRQLIIELQKLHSYTNHSQMEALMNHPLWPEWFKLYTTFKQIQRYYKSLYFVLGTQRFFHMSTYCHKEANKILLNMY